MGNSISIELPSNWYNSKWIGFTLWASVLGFIGWKYGIRARVIALSDMPQNHWAFELFTTVIRLGNGICLLYLSRDEWLATLGNGECSQIEVIFECDENTTNLGECGVNLIYEQDVDEFNQTNAQCLIESIGEEVPIYKLTSNDHLKHSSRQCPILLYLIFFLTIHLVLSPTSKSSHFSFSSFGSPRVSNHNHLILSEFLKIKLKLLLLSY